MGETAELKNDYFEHMISKIYYRYGYDFRNYSRASLYRRITGFLHKNNLKVNERDISKVLDSKTTIEKLIQSISVTVTELFRDPEYYKQIRESILPRLANCNPLKIWHAGCATGEEPYSLAIVLKEEGFSNVEITATDINRKSLDIAQYGVYPNKNIKDSTLNYLKSGGKGDLADYYHSRYNNSIIKKELRKNINFKYHDLTSGFVIDKFDIVICRNVFIYFTKDLQKDVFDLLKNSLATPGYLWLGSKESLLFIDDKGTFSTINKKAKIYMKNTN